jgi:hypothetical protein
VKRYDSDDNLYWVLYSDGDSEEMEESEVADAVQNYSLYVTPEADHSTGSSSTPVLKTVAIEEAVTAQLAEADGATFTAVSSAADSLHSPALSELTLAVQAMTAAAERLSSAATRIEAAVQTQYTTQMQRQQWRQQQWQQQKWQQQQQQLRVVYYQQQQLMYWQQQQQYFYNFKRQCRR